MLPSYEDIYKAAWPHAPDWHDTNGVPRFTDFHPDLLGIYDNFAILGEIACQSCGYTFYIGEGWTKFDMRAAYYDQPIVERTIESLTKNWGFHDPPRHQPFGPAGGGGCAGDTMGSVERRLVEVWEKVSESKPHPSGNYQVLTKMPEWTHRLDLEGPIK